LGPEYNIFYFTIFTLRLFPRLLDSPSCFPGSENSMGLKLMWRPVWGTTPAFVWRD